MVGILCPSLGCIIMQQQLTDRFTVPLSEILPQHFVYTVTIAFMISDSSSDIMNVDGLSPFKSGAAFFISLVSSTQQVLNKYLFIKLRRVSVHQLTYPYSVTKQLSQMWGFSAIQIQQELLFQSSLCLIVKEKCLKISFYSLKFFLSSRIFGD